MSEKFVKRRKKKRENRTHGINGCNGFENSALLRYIARRAKGAKGASFHAPLPSTTHCVTRIVTILRIRDQHRRDVVSILGTRFILRNYHPLDLEQR